MIVVYACLCSAPHNHVFGIVFVWKVQEICGDSPGKEITNWLCCGLFMFSHSSSKYTPACYSHLHHFVCSLNRPAVIWLLFSDPVLGALIRIGTAQRSTGLSQLQETIWYEQKNGCKIKKCRDGFLESTEDWETSAEVQQNPHPLGFAKQNRAEHPH